MGIELGDCFTLGVSGLDHLRLAQPVAGRGDEFKPVPPAGQGALRQS